MNSGRRVVFVGAVHEATPALEVLLRLGPADVVGLVTAPEDTLSTLSGAVDLTAMAQEAGIPVIRTDDINAGPVVDAIRSMSPDLLVVVGWTRLIGKQLLSVPRRGCVGFHASLLPKHRGRAPVNWSIIQGETVTGNTMMLLDPGADTGAIVDQRQTPISEDDTCGSVYVRVAELGAQMLVEHLPALLNGVGPRHLQNPDEGDILPKRTSEMGVINWADSARAVHNWIRALTHPYPGAFSDLAGERIMVWRSSPPRAKEQLAAPGMILDCGEGGLRVAVGDGAIVCTELSTPEGPPMPALEWCASRAVRPGTAFTTPDAATVRWSHGGGEQPGSTRTVGGRS